MDWQNRMQSPCVASIHGFRRILRHLEPHHRHDCSCLILLSTEFYYRSLQFTSTTTALLKSNSAQSTTLQTTISNENNNDNDALRVVLKIVERQQKRTPIGFWSKESNHRLFFDEVAKRLGVTKFDDWYNIRHTDVQKLGGGGLLYSHYGNSLTKALSTVYPEHKWQLWRFAAAPRKFWRSASHDQHADSTDDNHNKNNISNQRAFFDWAGAQLGVRHLDDWYNVQKAAVHKIGGAGIIYNYYGGSLVAALSAVYPEHDWLPWRFRIAPRRVWKDPQVHKAFFDWATKQLGINKPEDWYNVSFEDISKLGGEYLLTGHYGSSLMKALSAVYPEHEWLPWRFAKVAEGFWCERSNQLWFMEWAAKQLNIGVNLDCWYEVTVEEFLKLGGNGLLSRYDNSLFKALSLLYPEHEWLPWRFPTVPRGFWSDEANQRRFFDWAAKQLNVRTMDDWYNISSEDLARLGGSHLLSNYYGRSVVVALSTLYPQHEWQPWRSRTFTSQSALVKDEGWLRRYMEFVAKKLQIEQLDDWYRVSLENVRKLGGYTMLVENGGLFLVLKKLYPNHPWSEERFEQHMAKRATQRMLKMIIKQMFPDEEVFEEFYPPGLAFRDSAARMTLDICIPSLSLAFEYQGAQHYRDLHLFGSPTPLKARDEEKRTACAEAGITLILVPYYWFNSNSNHNDHKNDIVGELVRAIHAARPDIVESKPHLLEHIVR